MFTICSLYICVQKDGDIVGHMPRKISAICSLFLRRNETRYTYLLWINFRG